MEDQGKRLLLAVVIAFGIMLAWNFFFPPDKPPPEDQREAASQKEGKAPPPDADDAPEGAAETEVAPEVGEPEAEAPASRGEEELFDFEFDKFRARFSSYGGTLVAWKLLGDRYYDPVTGGPTDLVPNGELEAQRSFQVSFPDSTLEIPAEAEWRGERKSDRSIEFSWENSKLRVVKLFEIVPEDYLLRLTVKVENKTGGSAKQALAVSIFGYQDPEQDTGGGFTQLPREWKAACYVGDEVYSKSAKDLAGGAQERVGMVYWAGFNHSFFLSALAPNRSQEPQSDRLECEMTSAPSRAGAMRVDLIYPAFQLPAGEPYQRSVVAYLGPKYLDKLEAISAQLEETQGYDPAFQEAVDLGWLTFLARPLLWLLKWFQSFLVNWGLAIIFLTVVVKLATLPWTHKSMKSMKAMAKLKPQMEKIREKYADDKQRQQAETMNLFKAHKVNPLAGCLPILLQMPIWIALYRALTVAAELYQAPFIPGWIDDLTSPDPFYIMPILLTGMMFLQSKLTPTPTTGAQQKVMQYGMPIMFGVMSFFFPAGLTLYIFTNTLLTAFHHLFMHRGERGKKEEESGGEEVAEAAGKAVAGGASGAKAAGAAAGASSSKPAGTQGADSDAAGKSQGQRKKKGKKSGKRKKRSR